jgi:hypothetical protein
MTAYAATNSTVLSGVGLSNLENKNMFLNLQLIGSYVFTHLPTAFTAYSNIPEFSLGGAFASLTTPSQTSMPNFAASKTLIPRTP